MKRIAGQLELAYMVFCFLHCQGGFVVMDKTKSIIVSSHDPVRDGMYKINSK